MSVRNAEGFPVLTGTLAVCIGNMDFILCELNRGRHLKVVVWPLNLG